MKSKNTASLMRKIVDYHKLNEDILALLVEKYPYGYEDRDIITFRNAKNELIEAVEVRTEDTIYLVKVGLRLVQAMEDFEADSEDDDYEDESDSDNDNMDDFGEEFVDD